MEIIVFLFALLSFILVIFIIVWINQIKQYTKKNADYSFIQSLIMLERAKTDKLASSKELINKFSKNYSKIKRSNSYSNQMIEFRSGFSIEELEAIEQGLVDPLKIDILDLASAMYVPVSKLFK